MTAINIEQLVEHCEDSLKIVVGSVSLCDLTMPYAILRLLYQQLTDTMLRLGRPLLDVILLLPPNYAHTTGHWLQMERLPPPSTLSYKLGQFPVVAIGGTFDHLHAGHKLMLSVAVMLTGSRLVVGLTDEGDMLARKQYKQRIESWEERKAKILLFIGDFAGPNFDVIIVKLMDPFGPTITDVDIDALVVSHETISGGEASIFTLSST